MPAPIIYSHKILKEMATARKSGDLKLLGPDSKSQISVVYENSKPIGVSSVVVSSQHDESIDQNEVKEMIRPYIKKVLPGGWSCPEEQFYVNPTGKFVIGGPDGDTGLTGRKIIVDTYGGAALHGGGAFSGKDPSKVDRSAAYAARYLAKNIVASGIVDKAVIQLSYAIGVSQPLSIYLDIFQDNQKLVEQIIKVIQSNFDLSPKGIRNKLELNKPIYKKTAAYGHFGRSPESDGSFSWEKTDMTDVFKKEI
jgi:S-adenosylmethionine synthetase